MAERCDVAVLGGGIAGLTAAALLATEGLEVVLLEAHSQSGGCAGTFRRGPYTFDVGATQVAGFEPGGIHRRLMDHFALPLPGAAPGSRLQRVAGRGDGTDSAVARSPALGGGAAAPVPRQRAVLGPLRPAASQQLGLRRPRSGAAPATPGTGASCWRPSTPG